MGIHLDVLCLLSVVDLSSEILHTGDRATILANMHDREEEISVFLPL